MGTALMPHVEKDGTVTCENFYFAVQSQVLCNVSYEAAVMLRVMKFFCCLFAVFMGFLAVVLQTLGLGLGFVYMSMGIFVGPAVAPAAMAILMEKASAQWCTIGAIAGLCGGLTTWIATAQYYRGEVTLATLGGDYPFPLLEHRVHLLLRLGCDRRKHGEPGLGVPVEVPWRAVAARRRHAAAH